MSKVTQMAGLFAAGVVGAGLSAAQANGAVLLDAGGTTIAWQANPDRHYGDYNWFTVTDDPAYVGFIRFDLSSLTTSIESAEMRMEHLYSAASAGDVEYRFYGVAPGTANEDWIHGPRQDVLPGADSPAPLTWNNAPGLASEEDVPTLNLAEIWGGGTSLGSIQADWADYGYGSSEIFSFSTDELADYLNAVAQSENKLANLIMLPTGPIEYDSARVQWIGKTYEGNLHGQGEYGPQLQLTLVPEPSTLALAGMAGVLAFARRRRSA